MTTVVCVLKTGGVYDFGHVARLAFQLHAHGVDGSDFLCLTDDERTLEADFAEKLEFGWPGWWSKIEVLNRPGPLLYLDLDVNVVGDLTPLLAAAARHDFIMSRGFWGDEDPNPYNSSVMAWKGDAPRHLYDRFLSAPERYIAEHTKMPAARTRWGDQGFIAAHHPWPIDTWQAALAWRRFELQARPAAWAYRSATHASWRAMESRSRGIGAVRTIGCVSVVLRRRLRPWRSWLTFPTCCRTPSCGSGR